MDLTELKNGLRQWVADFCGTTKVYWRDQPEGHRPPAYVLLHLFGMVGKGTDGVRYRYVTPADPDDIQANEDVLEVSVEGNRLFTLQVEARSLNQGHTQRADMLTTNLRDRAAWPRSQAALKALNLAIVRIEADVDLSATVDQRVESRVVMDIRFQTRIRETDSAGNTGYFERAELETTYTDAGDDPVLVTTDTFGVEDE